MIKDFKTYISEGTLWGNTIMRSDTDRVRKEDKNSPLIAWKKAIDRLQERIRVCAVKFYKQRYSPESITVSISEKPDSNNQIELSINFGYALDKDITISVDYDCDIAYEIMCAMFALSGNPIRYHDYFWEIDPEDYRDPSGNTSFRVIKEEINRIKKILNEVAENLEKEQNFIYNF